MGRFSFVVVLIMFCFGCKEKPQTQTNDLANGVVTTSNQSLQKVPPPKIEIDALAGNWVRTDAPYKLNIMEFVSDGTIKAEYLNPKPIHIGKASWLNNNSLINIYVELRDENYPGSAYTLYYLPEKDLLAGKYYQAVEGVTYDVGFMRAK